MSKSPAIRRRNRRGNEQFNKMTSDPFMLPALSLAKRELVRFVRQRSRIIGALVTPIFFWVAIGLGMGHSFQASAPGGDLGFIAYFYPGTILMILLFTAIFSTISIIEDRREGFLQSVLVAPISRLSMVLGKILGGTLLAVIQGMLFLFIGLTIGVPLSPVIFAEAVGVMFLIAF